MTQDQWATILTPIISILVTVVATLLGLVLTGLTAKLRAYLDAKGHAEASRVVADASVRVQAAMQNAAGQIALEIQTGKLDPTNMASIRFAAARYATEVERKVPEALATLKPATNAVADGILGKVTTALPSAPAAAPEPVAAPEPDLNTADTFQARASIVVSRLMRDLDLVKFQAAGIVGNLGTESGIQAINEIKPVSGRGGFGWAQWTGPRRDAFEAWCKANGLHVTDPEANYGFLLEELRTTEAPALAALKATTTLEEATRVFEERFERAGVVAMNKRVTFAQMAMAA